MKVFLSHSHKDIELAKKIREALKHICDVYIASEDRQPGQLISNKVETNIRLSRFLVALITKDALKSKWVDQEIGIARACHISIIPIVEQGLKIEGILEGIEYIEFNKNNPDVAIKSLTEYIHKIKKAKDLSDIFALSLAFLGLFMLIGKGK